MSSKRPNTGDRVVVASLVGSSDGPYAGPSYRDLAKRARFVPVADHTAKKERTS